MIDAFESLAAMATTLPRRVIVGELGPYLTRYVLRECEDGGHLYLHHFHRSDADSDLHNHPWPGSSVILAGGYVEERLADGEVLTLVPRVRSRTFLPGDSNVLEPDTFHRVDLLDEARGCWTLFRTGARVQSWGFRNRATGEFTPWREAFARRGLLPERSAFEMPKEAK